MSPNRGARIQMRIPYLNSSEKIIAPPKPFAITAWNANDNSNHNTSEVQDMYSNRKTSEVRDSLYANAETYVRSQTPYESMRMDTPNNTNPPGFEGESYADGYCKEK